MSYKINGVDIILQPEKGGWKDRQALGIDGNNRPIYEPTHQFEMYWGTMTMAEFNQLYVQWLTIASSGTVSVDLPQLDAAIYTYKTYVGVILEEPNKGQFWEGYLTRVTQNVRNIIL